MMGTEDLRQAFVVASYEVRKYLRSRRLLGMVVLLALIIGLILGLPPALGSPYPSTPNAFVGTFAGFTALFAVLCGVLFAADALCSEHEKRTGYFLFPNPVRRETIVLGKLLASLAASWTILLVYYGVASAAALAVTGSLTAEVGLSAAYALAYVTCIVGVAFLLSSVLKGTIAATVLTFFLFTLIFTIIGGLLQVGKVSPWFIPTQAAGIISNVLSAPARGPPEFPAFVPDPATSLLVFAVYFIVSVVVATVMFHRRELKT